MPQEAARLEVLRSHVAGLKEVSQQCGDMQRRAEAHAIDLSARLGAATREVTLKTQENARLKWTLSNTTVAQLKDKALKAFNSAGDARKMTQQLTLARERHATAHRTDDCGISGRSECRSSAPWCAQARLSAAA